MKPIEITADTSPERLASLALSIHRATDGMPVALKSRDRPGVLVDDGRVIDDSFEAEALDLAFASPDRCKAKAGPGPFEGLTMFTSAILDDEGRPVAAIGVVDRSGLLGLNEMAEIDERLRRQIAGDGRP